MANALRRLACFTLILAAGCKGCDPSGESAAPSTGAQPRHPQSERARVLARLAARKLDRDKTYPKDELGRAQCGGDVDCAILQAEGCKPATLTHVQSYSAYGITQRLHASYEIVGGENGRCTIERRVHAVDAELDPRMAEVLRQRGRSDADLTKTRDEAVAQLLHKHWSHARCAFSEAQALEAMLDLAEGNYDPQQWRKSCESLEAPVPRIGIADGGVQGAPQLGAAQPAPGEATAAQPAK